jgi:hypothetical protein
MGKKSEEQISDPSAENTRRNGKKFRGTNLRTKLYGTKCKSTQRRRMYQRLEKSGENPERMQRKKCTLC